MFDNFQLHKINKFLLHYISNLNMNTYNMLPNRCIHFHKVTTVIIH